MYGCGGPWSSVWSLTCCHTTCSTALSTIPDWSPKSTHCQPYEHRRQSGLWDFLTARHLCENLNKFACVMFLSFFSFLLPKCRVKCSLYHHNHHLSPSSWLVISITAEIKTLLRINLSALKSNVNVMSSEGKEGGWTRNRGSSVFFDLESLFSKAIHNFGTRPALSTSQIHSQKRNDDFHEASI